MTKRYRGTCIGGVADGHFIERDDVEISIFAARKVPVLGAAAGETAEEKLEESIYKFLILWQNTNVELGVWALNGMTIEQVIVRILNCYNPRTGLIGEPKPNPIPIRHA